VCVCVGGRKGQELQLPFFLQIICVNIMCKKKNQSVDSSISNGHKLIWWINSFAFFLNVHSFIICRQRPESTFPNVGWRSRSVCNGLRFDRRIQCRFSCSAARPPWCHPRSVSMPAPSEIHSRAVLR
jgi:hypothetical protein